MQNNNVSSNEDNLSKNSFQIFNYISKFNKTTFSLYYSSNNYYKIDINSLNLDTLLLKDIFILLLQLQLIFLIIYKFLSIISS
jgi:hypothetical protein